MKPYEIPSYFTVEFYRSQKELGKTDLMIAAEMHYSLPLIAKWKRQIGWKKGMGAMYAGRRPELDRTKIEELYRQGMRTCEIAKEFGVNYQNIVYHIRKLRVAESHAI